MTLDGRAVCLAYRETVIVKVKSVEVSTCGVSNMKKNEYVMGELFCGPGGIALGAFSATINSGGNEYKISHGFAVDYDPSTVETYRHNLSPDHPETVICEDVKKLDVKSLPNIDGFAFGFPCNDFSLVGEQKGFDGEYGPLYTYGLKVIKHFNPIWFVAENVGGLQSANEGNAFQKILSDLEKCGKGYILTPHLYKFEEYGVPQKRHRIIIVGLRKDIGKKFEIPAPTTPNPSDYKNVKQALTIPPIAIDTPNQEITRQSLEVIERLKYIPEGKNAWCEELPLHLRLNVKGAKLSQIYKRLDSKQPSYTITGSGGGGTHVYHWSENRALTNRERARIQTFPDWFEFKGSKEQVRKQIGMAVPPDGAKVIFEALLKTLAGESYDSISGKWS